jgi:hypothetical protein
MNKRKQIKLLTSELEQERESYQRTHDTLWSIFQLLCDEFNMQLTIRAKSLLEPECTDDPCICQNGIGCTTKPYEEW